MGRKRDPTTDQPLPHGTGPTIGPLVKADIDRRTDVGIKKYGEPLRANNGRDALVDAYEEAIDLVMYLRQAIEERNAVKRREGQKPLDTFPTLVTVAAIPSSGAFYHEGVIWRVDDTPLPGKVRTFMWDGRRGQDFDAGLLVEPACGFCHPLTDECKEYECVGAHFRCDECKALCKALKI